MDLVDRELEKRLLIRGFGSDEEVAPITRLLREAYRSLGESGFRYTATYQDDATTARRLHAGFPLVAELDGVVVATVTLYATALESECEWYTHPGVYRFGQFGVRPDLQRGGIGSRLLKAAEQLARERSAAELALDTAEGAAHLREWYDRLGFRFIQYVSWPTTNYRSVILSRELRASAGEQPEK